MRKSSLTNYAVDAKTMEYVPKPSLASIKEIHTQLDNWRFTATDDLDKFQGWTLKEICAVYNAKDENWKGELNALSGLLHRIKGIAKNRRRFALEHRNRYERVE